jgi:flagellar hook-associated protein 3 FlgL
MRIPNLTMSDAVVNRLNRLNRKQNQLNEQIATGQRITMASEDPQAASRVMRLRSEKMAAQQYARNTNVALGISQATYAAVDRLRQLSDRAGELAAASNSDNVSAQERAAYAVEVDQLIQAAIESGNTKFQGDYLFNGLNTDTTLTSTPEPFVLALGTPPSSDSVSQAESTDGAQIQISDTLSIAPRLKNADNQNIAKFINNLVALRDGLRNSSTSDITNARKELLLSENEIVGVLANNASIQARLESVASQSASRFNDIEALISRDSDVDQAQAMVNLTRQQTAYQAAMQAGAQVLKMSLLDYI